jgi:hypothetical protein
MSSAVNGLGSFDPLTLINSLTASAQSTTAAASTSGVSAKDEFSALLKSGDLEGLLSDNIAVGVMQIANPSSTSSTAGTDLTSMVNQLISAYATPAAASTSSSSSGSSTAQQSADTLPMNPALAIIQAMEKSGALGPTLADSIGASVLGQITA